MGILIEPLSWDLMATKAATRKAGISLDRAAAQSEIEIVALPEDSARMLSQLGIREQERGRVRSAAPLGGPILLEIGGSAVAIARGVAKKIKVRII